MSEEILYTVVGLVALYSIGHFYVIQFTKTWEQRTKFDRIMTVMAIVFIILLLFTEES